MIERQVLGGRDATVSYMTDAFGPPDRDTAPYVKVLFDDGEMLILATGAPDGIAEAEAWNRHRMQQRKPFGGQPKRGVVLGHSMAEWAGYFVRTDLARIDTAI